MRLFNRIIPWVSAFAFWLLAIQMISLPQYAVWLGCIALGLVVIATWQLTGRSIVNVRFWRLLITPLLSLGAGLLFLSFIETSLLKQVTILTLVIFLWAYLEILFLRFHFRPRYQAHSLENITAHLSALGVFFAGSGMLGLSIFIGLPQWQMAIAWAVFIFALVYELSWSSGLTVKTTWHYLAVITVISTELFVAVYFLPTSMYVGGVLLATSYYLMIGLARNWLLDVKEPSVVKRYVGVSMAVIVAVLLTAKWF